MAMPTTFNTFFWQWINQTYFAGLNFQNRNASNVMNNVNVFLGFTAAAASGVFMAVFMRKLLGRFALRMSPGNLTLFNSTTSFLALAGAGVINSVVMRSNEL